MLNRPDRGWVALAQGRVSIAGADVR
jgi:hypothetical protein